jgi:hypothetical protein
VRLGDRGGELAEILRRKLDLEFGTAELSDDLEDPLDAPRRLDLKDLKGKQYLDKPKELVARTSSVEATLVPICEVTVE